MTSDLTNSLSLLVLAAGLGSRYGGLKQLEQVGPNGETLMDYSIYDAKKAGFSRIVFLIREEMFDQFKDQVGKKYDDHIEVEYAFQKMDDLPNGFKKPRGRSRPWGTGHAVWSARKKLNDSFFAVINADDFYGAETFNLLEKALSKMKSGADGPQLISMIGFRLSETLSEHGSVSRGICQESDGLLQSVEEWTGIGGKPISGLNPSGEIRKLSGSEIVSMNVWGFSNKIFNFLEMELSRFLAKLNQEDLSSEFYLPTAVDSSIQGGVSKVEVYHASCSWMGVTYKEDKEKVKSSIMDFVERELYPNPLF